MESRYLTVEEAAARLRTKPATMHYWRHVGRGPASFKLGRRVLYKEGDVEAFVQAAIDAEKNRSTPADGPHHVA